MNFFLKKVSETLAGSKNRRTFASAIEKQRQVVDRQEAIFEEIYIIRQVVQVSESRYRWEKIPSIGFWLWATMITDGIRAKDIKRKNSNNEEFDPGSGWTLATGLTHASRGAARCSNTRVATGARVSNAYATCLSEGDNPSKDGLIPHKTGAPHGDIC